MTVTFKINGKSASEEAALNAFVNYDTMNAGSDRCESIAVFDKALERDMDGAIARDYLVEAGVEVFFSGTGSSYDVAMAKHNNPNH